MLVCFLVDKAAGLVSAGYLTLEAIWIQAEFLNYKRNEWNYKGLVEAVSIKITLNAFVKHR